MIGSFGNIAFTTSAQQVRTFAGLSKQAEARYAEHALAGKKPLLEFVGPGLEQVSFSIRLDKFLGLDPVGEIERIVNLRDEGEAQPLVIGGKYLGMYVITNASEARKFHDNRGVLIQADISLTLKEYADD